MSAAPYLSVITPNDLPNYPISAEERLDGNSFVKWNTSRWLASRTFKLMPWDMQGMHRALFDFCQSETPVGTLPDDDDELAVMLRIDVRRLKEIRAMEFGALRNWTRCLCDGRVRLMHKVVTEQVQDALERRALAALSKDEKAVSMRLDRLRKGMAKLGWSKDVLRDDVLIRRVDAWMLENRKGRRDAAAYDSAAMEAIRQRWIEPGMLRGG